MSDEEIHGRRVSLVPLGAEHADELAGLLADAFVRDALGVGDVEGLRRRFAAWESRRSPDGDERWLNWVVRESADGRALGWVQATVRGGTASLAYALLAAERRRGAASDAVRAMMRWLAAELEVGEFRASIAPANLASAQVARAVGLEPTERRDAGEIIWVARRAHCNSGGEGQQDDEREAAEQRARVGAGVRVGEQSDQDRANGGGGDQRSGERAEGEQGVVGR